MPPSRNSGITKWVNIALRKSAGDQYQYAAEEWIPISAAMFANTWIDAAPGSGEDVSSFMRDSFGWVHLRGRIKRGTPVGVVTAAETMFTLPVGYRPLFITRWASLSGTSGAAVFQGMRINAVTGAVAGQGPGTGGTDGAVTIGPMSFRVDVGDALAT